MQGLALADFLTALSSYGLQPLFQNRYKCYHTDITDSYECDLEYPYCSVAVYLSISSTLFHTVSNLLTTFLGMQKVIAIRFPIWTRFHLTNRKAVICCFITFLLCVPFSVPRYFVIDFKYDPTIWCTILPNNIWLLKYSSMYYLLIQTILMTSCCVIMMMSAVFIVFKLINNIFSGRMTEHRRQERRSVVMVVLVLIVFLVTEKVCSNLWFCITYISDDFISRHADDKFWSIHLLMNYEHGAAMLMGFYSDDSVKSAMKNEDQKGPWATIFASDILGKSRNLYLVMEILKVITVLGCLSNFIIHSPF
ncbi:unnamed protein product [Mytilus edulis]|uniref:G-protein coupled receptors family 1 profile domain-containing protein n=1 Tax=Mytilus edulis TaxID=6550 RepID=A0A8S3TI26_MYTED|nr:unnamed protein product [Mytilus edulis]